MNTQLQHRSGTFLLFLCMVCIQPAHAQWDLYQEDHVQGPFFVDGDQAVVKGSGSVLWVTDDDGATWTQANTPWGSAEYVGALTFDGRFYVYGHLGHSSFIRTAGSMAEWEFVPGLVSSSGNPPGLSSLLTDGDILWIRTFDSVDHPNGQIFTSPDGENWTYITDALNIGNYTFFDGKLFATAGNQLRSSTDYGETWQTVGEINAVRFRGLMPGEDRLYGVFEPDGGGRSLHSSTDGGTSWSEPLFVTLQQPFFQAIPVGNAVLVFIANDMQISLDHGQTWGMADPHPPWAQFPVVSGDHIYVAKPTFDKWIRREPLATFGIGPVNVEEGVPQPAAALLTGNFPNPFTGMTTISYTLTRTGHVDLRVFDLLGREVAVLVDRVQSPGQSEITFDAVELSSGTYVYRLSVDGDVQTRRMLVVR